ncbi:MAG: hypothetical protein KC912_08185 [Proteobacteria bacterium]|nr:hypothetical protein [Pseudomonadota bacterium]
MLSRILGVVALAASTSAVAAPVTAYDYFPLEEGNTWVYATDNQGYLVDTEVAVISASNEAYLGGGWYVNEVTGLFGAPHDVYDHANRSTMWLYNSGWQHVFDFDAPVGASWSMDAGACDTYDVTVRPAGTATTPAGEFADLVDFGFTQIPDANVRCAGPGLSQVRFAPGIGPVDFSANNRKAHLLYARVNGAVAASGPRVTRTLDGIETSIVLTEDALTQPHGVYCFTTPCPQPVAELGFAFVLTNVSSTAQTLNFTSGQRFEIDLFDGEGANVLSWSDNQFFTQATSTVTLAAGQTEVFYGTLDIGIDGAQITGDFQAVGYMVNTEGAGKQAIDFTVAPAQ